MQNTITNQLIGLGGAGMIILFLLSLLIPLFIAGIYGNTRRIEKHLRKMAEAAEARPRIIEEQVRSATRPFERREGSIYPEPRDQR